MGKWNVGYKQHGPLPLCGTCDLTLFFQNDTQRYYQCPLCSLIVMDPRGYLSEEQEKREYELHQNSPEDQGYRKFLSRLALPLLDRLELNQRRGLDYGCGPGPTLSVMLEEAGCSMSLFDPFFFHPPRYSQRGMISSPVPRSLSILSTLRKNWNQY